jgi:hypothetical protein
MAKIRMVYGQPHHIAASQMMHVDTVMYARNVMVHIHVSPRMGVNILIIMIASMIASDIGNRVGVVIVIVIVIVISTVISTVTDTVIDI